MVCWCGVGEIVWKRLEIQRLRRKKYIGNRSNLGNDLSPLSPSRYFTFQSHILFGETTRSHFPAAGRDSVTSLNLGSNNTASFRPQFVYSYRILARYGGFARL